MKVYLGAPLFTDSQQMFNDLIARKVRECGFDVYNPQENGDINDKSEVVDSVDIFNEDTKELISCDCIIAVLDGQDVDSGLSAEMGIAYANNIPIYALYTDIRHDYKGVGCLSFGETPHHYINQYVIGLIKELSYKLEQGGLFNNLEHLIKVLDDDFDELWELEGYTGD